MNEFEAREYILGKKKDVKNADDVKALVEEVIKNFNYDYGVAPRSVGAACAVIADFLAVEMGMTGFQAWCIMWDFILGFQYTHNKCGLKMVDWDKMLYPQNGSAFEKTISKRTWEKLQEQAKRNLDGLERVESESVVDHWQSIVDGVVPFGYVVRG